MRERFPLQLVVFVFWWAEDKSECGISSKLGLLGEKSKIWNVKTNQTFKTKLKHDVTTFFFLRV